MGCCHATLLVVVCWQNPADNAGQVKYLVKYYFSVNACFISCAVQVRVASEIAHVLSLPRRQLDGFLGAVGSGLASRGQVLAALRQCRSLQVRIVLSWLAMLWCHEVVHLTQTLLAAL